MKKALFALLLTAFAFVAAWSQPKVAVLDAIIPQNMDPSIQGPATEKIIEKLVQSNRFTVLDRANIEGVLKEREFQVSGMVSDQDVVTAGKYLGADYVVVAKLSRVGDTNFISGKMINVKTGVIASQTSAQGDGKLSVLINLAGQVGETLSGGSSTPPPAEKEVVVTPPPEAPVVPEAPAQKEIVQPPAGPKGPLTENFIAFGFFYNSDTWSSDWTYSSYEDLYKRKLNFGTVQLEAVVAKYIQLGIGYSWFTSGTWTEDNPDGTKGSGDLLKDYTISYIDFNFLFRIPIRLGQSNLAFVPMAGFEYDKNLSYKDANGNDLKTGQSTEFTDWLNHFYFQIGAGLQIDAGNVVICPELIYGFKINSQYDTDWGNYVTQTLYSGYGDTSVSEGKLDLGILVGFKLDH